MKTNENIEIKGKEKLNLIKKQKLNLISNKNLLFMTSTFRTAQLESFSFGKENDFVF